MLTPQELLSQLQAQIGQVLPGVARAAQQDFQLHSKTALDMLVSRLDLVSREDFEIQTEVLRHTRERLEQMEKKVAALEAALGSTAKQ